MAMLLRGWSALRRAVASLSKADVKQRAVALHAIRFCESQFLMKVIFLRIVGGEGLRNEPEAEAHSDALAGVVRTTAISRFTE